ncbi:hypothetical protein HYPSUDRAFT_159478 [Hypholoma sublateritium FD-334 SS-4]|uniref:RNB domain-containing protein n=1 Tax=Hypholoma sublateritium (strain FD-334 SS-4) TaxID=945553 RepID=A0A0D2LFH9_HYPSF|nr:hypothetical protein HYPSUDRAFT_159478 [Hypholoma sublateritium FD-334 SS-4]
MRRHCIRSVLLQCTETPGPSSFQPIQRLSFSTSSSVLIPATPRPRPRPEQRRREANRDAGTATAPDKDNKKRKAPFVNPRSAFRNKATVDKGRSPDKPYGSSAPTPVRFINPGPLRGHLLQNQKELFLQGDGPPPVPEGDIQLGEELSLTATHSPGSFVELRRNERTSEAIVLTDRLVDGKLQTVCLTSTGEITATMPTDVFFSVPNVISADLAARCGTEGISETPQALNARIQALKQLRSISIEAQQAAQGSRMWDRQKILSVYDELKHHDPKKWGSCTLEQVADLFYVQPGYINYYATHKYLMERPLKYIAETGYIRNQKFRVRPERDVKEIQTVEDWIADYRIKPKVDGPYKNFIEKAQAVVDAYKKQPPRDSGPMTQEKWDSSWNDTDIVILSYLLRSLQQHISSQLDPYQIGRNTIVTDVLRVAEVSDDTIHRLLIELRIMAPWQDLHVLSPLLNPSGDFGARGPIEKELEQIYRASSHPQPIAGLVLGPYDFHPSDPLDSVRHDFGNLKTFVIDSHTASELDDGVSVERIPSEPENHWIHVHIADPARQLHPGHALSVRARTQFSALYFGTELFPMLPFSVLHDPKLGLSLTDTVSRDQPNHVMTFSIKVDGKAKVLDYKVRAGLLRNVRKTTYDEVDLALGNEAFSKTYPFGGTRPTRVGVNAPLSEDDLADLRLLRKLALDQEYKRAVVDRILLLDSTFVEIDMLTLPPVDIKSPHLPGAVYHGFPEMQYSVGSISNEDHGARNLVSEMMKLACQVASRFASDHDLPFIRRAVDPFEWPDYELALKFANNTNVISQQDFLKAQGFASSGKYMLEPGAHALLGLPAGVGYSRVTSPLRRFMDLALHWQIHHALLGSKAPARVPFSKEEMETLILEAGVKDVQYRRLEKANKLFYALMYLKRFASDTARGVERPNGDPLSRIKAWTLHTPSRDNLNSLSVSVVLPDLGIQAYAMDLPSFYVDLPPGSDLLVKLNHIDLGLRRTKMYVTLTS